MTDDVRHPHLSAGYTTDTAARPVAAPVTDAPQAEDLSALKVAELRERADAAGIDHEGLKKAEIIEKLGG